MSCPCCNPCQSLLITYDWSGTNQPDIDTGTTFLGTKVGWSCDDNNQYIEWGGDNTGQSASETVVINHVAALAAGLWSGSVDVSLAAGWYSPAGGSGPITVRVQCVGRPETEQSQVVSPGTQDSCASTSVGSITIQQAGSFSLNPLP